jgi:periplasmic protein TonB
MFEKAILTNKATKTPAAMVFGMLGELTAVGIAILIPLVYTEHLPAFMLSASIAVPQRAPDPAPAEAVKAARERGAQVVRVEPWMTFVAPVRIPEKVAMVIEEPVPAGTGQYVSGSTGSGSAGIPGLPIAAGNMPVAPPPKAAEPKSPPAERPIQRVVVGGNVQAAKILSRVIPVYPALAKQARVQGTVSLIGVIATDGTVRQLRVLSGHPLLVQAALEAVRQWVYRPILLNGDPVEIQAPIDVHFTLAQ